jgi:hypothetical protein
MLSVVGARWRNTGCVVEINTVIAVSWGGMARCKFDQVADAAFRLIPDARRRCLKRFLHSPEVIIRWQPETDVVSRQARVATGQY